MDSSRCQDPFAPDDLSEDELADRNRPAGLDLAGLIAMARAHGIDVPDGVGTPEELMEIVLGHADNSDGIHYGSLKADWEPRWRPDELAPGVISDLRDEGVDVDALDAWEPQDWTPAPDASSGDLSDVEAQDDASSAPEQEASADAGTEPETEEQA